MTKPTNTFDRRRLLRGAGGLAMSLPALQAFAPRSAKAAGPKKVFTVFMCQQNGAVPERFFPTQLGPLTTASLTGDFAVSELKDHAADLTIIRGINWAFGNSVGCGHSSGCNVALTASKPTGRANRSLPLGPSADYVIGMGQKREPLNLYAGKKDSYLADAFAYGPGGRVRVANNNPFTVYQSLMGIDAGPGPGKTDPGLAEQIGKRRKSVNDLLRAQIQELLGRKDLSAEDRRRLDVHFSSVRDVEIMMTTPGGSTGMMGSGSKSLQDLVMTLKDRPDANELMEDAVRAQLSLIALAFAGDRTQIATLQIGGGNDHAQYKMPDGTLAPPYHYVSHHVLSDGEGGTKIPNAVDLHHQIDRIHGRFFRHLIERLKEHKTVDGRPLLDDCAAVWMNSLSNGPPHGTNNVPHVIAGTAGGFLKKGVYVDVAGAKNSKFLNTMITASGVTKADGAPFDNFGDAGVPTGLMTEIVA